ncbi:MAG: DUF3137 domain-containing protein [Acholeplasmatales bacterium]|jgi:hypothetical protein|nr:DUF3137 domain-containing protein [Acholeplasmatales bacterium]
MIINPHPPKPNALDNDLNSLEIIRKKKIYIYYFYLIFLILSILAIVVPVVMIIIRIIIVGPALVGRIYMLFLVIGTVLCFIFNALYRIFRKQVKSFKKDILNGLFPIITRNIYQNEVVFNANEGLDLEEISRPDFFQRSIGYDSSNLLMGKYQGLAFKMSDFLLEIKNNTAGDTNKNNVIKTKGRMLIMKLPAKRSMVINVMERKGNYKHNFLQRLSLDNAEFNQKFNVYSAELKEALHFLSNKMQNIFLDLEKQFSGGIYFRLVGDICYVAIVDKKKTFNLSITKPFSLETINSLVPSFLVPKTFIDAFIAYYATNP